MGADRAARPRRASAGLAGLLAGKPGSAGLAAQRGGHHDTAALRGPQWYSRGYVAWRRALLPRIAARARHVVTVSEFSRREIVSLLGAPSERVSVIPGGVDERFRADLDPQPARSALGLHRPYVLTVASATARKNLDALSLAARRLAGEGVEVVAVGGARPQFRAEDSPGAGRLGATGGAPGGVRMLGPVADELLPSLYAGAQAFVLPSLYEGFGLTCVEAMATGVPVVAADRAALPETCAGGRPAGRSHRPRGGRRVADAGGGRRGAARPPAQRRAGTSRPAHVAAHSARRPFPIELSRPGHIDSWHMDVSGARTALVHDFLLDMRGAERVTLAGTAGPASQTT